MDRVRERVQREIFDEAEQLEHGRACSLLSGANVNPQLR